MSVSTLTVVNDVAMDPVSIEMMTSPARVQTTPNRRPAIVSGALSPYLTIKTTKSRALMPSVNRGVNISVS